VLRAGGIGPACALPSPAPNYAVPAPRPGRSRSASSQAASDLDLQAGAWRLYADRGRIYVEPSVPTLLTDFLTRAAVAPSAPAAANTQMVLLSAAWREAKMHLD
jgi:hypothetical protein